MLPEKLFSAYIFDLDGTVYLGETLLPGAGEAIHQLRSLGKRTVFLSNNPTRTREAYAEKLSRLGLPTSAGDVVNSTVVMVEYLQRYLPGARLYVVGEPPLQEALRAGGFELAEAAERVDAVIASFDRTFVYRKLQIAFDAIRAGARLFATNADRYCPVPPTVPGGPVGGEPDAAAIIAAIEACTGARVEAVAGKPSRHMAAAVLRLLDLPPQDCLITGDRLETDVRMGLEAGMPSALTLTGASSAADLAQSPFQPDYLIRRLSDLIPR